MAARMLALLGAANAAAVAGLWVRGGGLHDAPLTSLGRLTGLLGAYLALVELLVLARGPRTSAFHRWAGHAVLWLLVAHTLLITAGYAVADDSGPLEQARRLIRQFPGVITATAGLGLLIGVAAASAVRRRLRYETWYFIHLYAYLAVALAFSHQLATGTALVGDPLARAYWYALYGVTLAAVVARFALPLRHRLRVERVVEAGPGVVNVEISGRVRRGRASSSAGASSRAGAGSRRIRSRSRRRRTGAGCGSPSRASATTAAGCASFPPAPA
jgi:DMSO/TMAO reductase YedYZ heme-binding membrane subunit